MKHKSSFMPFIRKLLRRQRSATMVAQSIPVQPQIASTSCEEDYPRYVTRLVFSSTQLTKVRLLGQEFCVEPFKILATFEGVPTRFKGAMLYENHVVPLVDLRTGSGYLSAPEPGATLVFKVLSRHVGIVVDALPRNVQVPFSDITFATEDSTRLYPFLEGEMRIGESFLRLISMERLLAPRLDS